MFNGKLIVYLRRQRGLSQQDVADALHVTRGTVSNWEQGKRTPDIATFINIADFFNVSLDLFVLQSVYTASREICTQCDAFFNSQDIKDQDKKLLIDAITEIYNNAQKK